MKAAVLYCTRAVVGFQAAFLCRRKARQAPPVPPDSRKRRDGPDDLFPSLGLHVLDDLGLYAVDPVEERPELARALHLDGRRPVRGRCRAIGGGGGFGTRVEGAELHARRGEVVVDHDGGRGLGGPDPGHAGQDGVGRVGGLDGCKGKNEARQQGEG